jgi:hypothetical protein
VKSWQTVGRKIAAALRRESEARIRKGKNGELTFSEICFIRRIYLEKAEREKVEE